MIVVEIQIQSNQPWQKSSASFSISLFGSNSKGSKFFKPTTIIAKKKQTNNNPFFNPF